MAISVPGVKECDDIGDAVEQVVYVGYLILGNREDKPFFRTHMNAFQSVFFDGVVDLGCHVGLAAFLVALPGNYVGFLCARCDS